MAMTRSRRQSSLTPMLTFLLLQVACAPSTNNDNATRRGSPVATDTGAGVDTASDASTDSGQDLDTADTAADTADTGADTSTDTADTAVDTADTAVIVDGQWTGMPNFSLTHAEYGTYACNAGGSFVVTLREGTFQAVGECHSTNLGVWTFSFSGSLSDDTLVVTEATVVSESYRCATQTLDTASGLLTPDAGTFSFGVTTDYSPCSAPYVWLGTGTVALSRT